MSSIRYGGKRARSPNIRGDCQTTCCTPSCGGRHNYYDTHSNVTTARARDTMRTRSIDQNKSCLLRFRVFRNWLGILRSRKQVKYQNNVTVVHVIVQVNKQIVSELCYTSWVKFESVWSCIISRMHCITEQLGPCLVPEAIKGAFLCVVFPCLCGISPGTIVSSHSQKKCG